MSIGLIGGLIRDSQELSQACRCKDFKPFGEFLATFSDVCNCVGYFDGWVTLFPLCFAVTFVRDSLLMSYFVQRQKVGKSWMKTR